MISKGVFTVSIDVEFAWGVRDKKLSHADLKRIRDEVEITKRLIALFEKYKIPATWAIVGRLLEEGKEGRLPLQAGDPAWFDTENLIRAIQQSPVPHEIGSHSFEHIIYGASSDDEAERDVENARRVHAARDIPFLSFVFPRNSEGHHALLKKHGISAYRGFSKKWYSTLPYRLWPLFEGIDYLLPTARTVLPMRDESGLINISDSINFVSRKSLKKLLSPSQIVRKLKRGLNQGAKRRQVFHLWFHPSNFSYDTDTQLETLEQVLSEAASLRDAGRIDVLTIEHCAQML